jgi:hypothetical protein
MEKIMKPAMDAVRDYLDSKKIRYEESGSESIRFSLLIPTPELTEMPNRLVSCGIRIKNGKSSALILSVTVMSLELTEELIVPITSFFMRFQSSHIGSGKVAVHPEGSILYQLTQFTSSGGTSDEQAVSLMITTAILEIAAIFLAKDEIITILPTATVPRFGMA